MKPLSFVVLTVGRCQETLTFEDSRGTHTHVSGLKSVVKLVLLGYVTFQGTIEIGSHKRGGR